MTHAHETLQLDLGERSYPIHIGTQLLGQSAFYAQLPRAAQALIVSNSTVAPLYAQTVAAALAPHYGRVQILELPDGEAYKNWDSLNQIFDTLLSTACDRKTVLFALGGGVVGDITGFAAACYMRGVPFVQIPTTLLSQVDSSVGGKTAINHPMGKNMIGAFYQPQMVLCDLSTLCTLPAREISAGLAEIIKYGPIADAAFFGWLEDNIERLRALDEHALRYAVARSCAIKADVVSRDEREGGVRAILNFGHTFGHAIEAGMGYGVWLHGEAVGAAMVIAAQLSRELGLISASYCNRIVQLISRASLPTCAPASITPQEWLEHMRVDKKAQSGSIQYILITDDDSDGKGEKAGEMAILRSVPDELVLAVIAKNTQ